MKGINDLPIDHVWPIIFKNLSIRDILNCRLVNKLFREFSDNYNNIDRIIIGEPSLKCRDYYWYYNNRSIQDNEMISLRCFRIIKRLPIFNLNISLKYLKIYDHQFELEEISNLINLESIEFGYYCNKNFSNHQIVKIRNLKNLVSNNLSIDINSPKLEKIQFQHINKINFFSDPTSIKNVITFNFSNELKIFRNLEILELRDIHQFNYENVLIIFNSLKQLKINLNVNKIDYEDVRMIACVTKILDDKIKLRREFDLYLEGIKVEDIDKFKKSIYFKKYSYWPRIFRNYDSLDLNIPFICHLSYFESDYQNLPSSFFDKFFNINNVHASDSLMDLNRLNWFLNNLKYLKKLKLECLKVDEVFLNNLPNTIKYLEIDNSEDINYNFILKLSKLIVFKAKVNKDLFDLVFKSFLNLKYLKHFRFYFKGEIEISKNQASNVFYLNKKRLNYNQLVEECNKIRLK